MVNHNAGSLENSRKRMTMMPLMYNAVVGCTDVNWEWNTTYATHKIG